MLLSQNFPCPWQRWITLSRLSQNLIMSQTALNHSQSVVTQSYHVPYSAESLSICCHTILSCPFQRWITLKLLSKNLAMSWTALNYSKSIVKKSCHVPDSAESLSNCYKKILPCPGQRWITLKLLSQNLAMSRTALNHSRTVDGVARKLTTLPTVFFGDM